MRWVSKMADVPGNSTNTGRGVFDTRRNLGGFSPTNRRSFLDGALQAPPAAPTLLQIKTTLQSNTDVDTYRIQWQGAARIFNHSITGGSVAIWQHSAANNAKCYPIVKGGQCPIIYQVLCQCRRIDWRTIEQQYAVATGPLKDIGFYGVGSEQAIYVRNARNERFLAFNWNNLIAADPKIISVQPLFPGELDNCGNTPSYCPVYPTRPKVANYPINRNDFIYAQISGVTGTATLRLF